MMAINKSTKIQTRRRTASSHSPRYTFMASAPTTKSIIAGLCTTPLAPIQQQVKPTSDNKSAKEKSEMKITGTTLITTGCAIPFLPTVAVILKSPEHSIQKIALLDTSSEATLIRQDIAYKLSLEGPIESSRITSYHADGPKSVTRLVDFKTQSMDQSTSTYATPTPCRQYN